MKKKIAYILATLFVVAVCTTAIVLKVKENAMYKDSFLSKKQLEEDYEYLWDYIENDYPFKNAFVRAGVDLEEFKATYRKRLHEPKDEFEYFVFYSSLLGHLTNFRYNGHLFVYSTYDLDYETKQIQDFQLHSEDEQAKRFYKNLVELEDKYISEHKAKEVYNKYDLYFNEYFERDMRKIEERYIESRVIKENEIGYLRIRSFMPIYYEEYEKRLDKMVKQFENYDHLIIDLRGNLGGYPYYWETYIVGPLLKKPIVYYNNYLLNTNNDFIKMINPDYPYTTSGFKAVKLNEQNAEDKSRFNASWVKTYTVYPTDYHSSFKGKIWILTDGETISASDLFVYFAKGVYSSYSSEPFATIVGENTGGDGLNDFWYRLYAKLPNSGLMFISDVFYGINRDGTCNSEVGSTPDIFNAPGKDALQTCLQEIKKLKK